MKYEWAVFKTTRGWSNVSHIICGYGPFTHDEYVSKACFIGKAYSKEKVTLSEGYKKCEQCESIIVSHVTRRLKG